MSDISTFLNDSDFEKHEPFKFIEVGDTIAGVIAEPPRIVPVDDLNDPGQKVDKLVIAITDQSGVTWAVWVGRGRMAKAIAEAVKKAGVTDIAEGGTLAIKHTALGERSKPQFSPPKLYAAKYEPPAKGVAVDDIFDDDTL